LNTTNSFIVLFFPRFAGGKFLSNCLALSRHCVPQDLAAANYLVDHPNDYQYRLDCILKTLPADQESMINWIPQYEFGDLNLYGKVINDWQAGVANYDLNQVTKKIIESGLKTFITTHGSEQELRNLCAVWPNLSIVKLVNHSAFRKISWSLKSDGTQRLDSWVGNYCQTKYNQLAGPSWPDWKSFENTGYDVQLIHNIDPGIQQEILEFYNWKNIDAPSVVFDVDRNYFDQANFLKAVEDLYQWLKFDDFDSNLVGRFWKLYMDLHKL
jgi:hypothetical protein